MRVEDGGDKRGTVECGGSMAPARRPIRPLLPNSLFVAFGFMASCLVATEIGWLAFTGVLSMGQYVLLLIVFQCAAICPCAVLARLKPDKKRLAKIIFMGSIAASISCCVSFLAMRGSLSRVLGVAASSCHIDPLEDPRVGSTAVSTVCNLVDSEGRTLARVVVMTDEQLDPSRLYRVAASIDPLESGSWHRYLFMRGCVSTLNVHGVISSTPKGSNPVHDFRNMMLKSISPEKSPGRALLAGVICGRVTELSQTDAHASFSATGLSHLVAVSGSHLAYIATLVQLVLIYFGAPAKGRVAATVFIAVLYVIFTGCAASAVRSCFMVAFSSFAVLLKRRPHSLSGLALSCIAICCMHPGTVWDLGFQLSAMSVLFLNVFCSYFEWVLTSVGAPLGLSQQLSMTFAAQWATIPLTVPAFGSISVISTVANLIVGPLMTGLLAAGLILVPISCFPCFHAAALTPLDALANASIFCAEALSRVPFGTIVIQHPAPFVILPYILAALLYLLWPSIHRAGVIASSLLAACLFMVHIVHWTVFAEPSIVVMDVGQADSILIREGASTLLVDAGVDEKALQALQRNNVASLDGVVLTHWDRDHWGGLPSILSSIPVKRLYIAKGAKTSMPEDIDIEAFDQIIELSVGDELRFGGFNCRVVWPLEEVTGEDNADSTCLVVSYQKNGNALKCLLTGDTELDEERAYQRDVGDIDVLKLGHHGSRYSVDDDLLDTLDPEVAIASAGRGNSYGHPSSECIARVVEYGARFYCTIDNGDIWIRPYRDAVKIGCSGSH